MSDEVEFEVGDLAVHPAQGVGRISAIEERNFGTQKAVVYVMLILGSDTKVMVPQVAAARVGLRPVMSARAAEDVFHVLEVREVAVRSQPWNRRFRAYTEMLASGDAEEIAKVLRDMKRRRNEKDLSFGERRLLEQSQGLLTQELALALDTTPEEIERRIDAIFSPPDPPLVASGH